MVNGIRRNFDVAYLKALPLRKRIHIQQYIAVYLFCAAVQFLHYQLGSFSAVQRNSRKYRVDLANMVAVIVRQKNAVAGGFSSVQTVYLYSCAAVQRRTEINKNPRVCRAYFSSAAAYLVGSAMYRYFHICSLLVPFLSRLMCYYKSIRREQKMTLIIVVAAVLDVGFIGGIVYLVFGKLLHSNALGKLF